MDDLHWKSGIDYKDILELHGNAFREKCQTCNSYYHRDYYCRSADTAYPGYNHYNGRNCFKFNCNGKLLDSIIYFNEKLDDNIYKESKNFANSSDLCISIGSVDI